MASSASVGSSIADSSSSFSRNLFQKLVENEKNNLVMSPVSVQTCLALAFFGAKGETESQLAKGLSLETSDKTTVSQRFSSLLKSSKNSNLLQIANKIFVSNHYHIKKPFNDVAKDAFQSEAEVLDFTKGDEAVKTINSWVEKKTNNNIKDLVNSVEPETSMILVNAIHLKAKWVYQFSNYSTHKSDFWITPETSVQVDIMSNSDHYHYGVYADLDAVAVGMPYKDSDMSMVIVVPNKRDGLADLEKKLANVDILALSNEMKRDDVDLNLPKFKIESSFNLKAPLKNMGMTEMFTDKANFSDLFEETIEQKVYEVFHKAFITVDEDGTEAAAATLMKFGSFSIKLKQKFVNVDHPFLYFIKNQDYIYFMGHVTKF